MNEKLASLYWNSLKMDIPGDPDSCYLDLGGNSIGIFILSEGIRKDLGKTIDPAILLSESSSLNRLAEQLEEF
ncbi:MAG: hypothetical protein COZ08_09135 [Bacteroidetes bacterium CG_4_10_14_3_um_filter_42_6]|nr:MAG: hypothetical protein COZ08_09135 [Bacteroidetes bacterium CG_4_10_14_3_um_filter_42_6]